MKKILILTAVLVLAATNCFAVGSGANGSMTLTTDVGLEMHGSTTGVAATKDTALIGKLSTGVAVGWLTTTGGYALVTQHKSGTKAFGSSYDSTAIFQYIKDAEPGTIILAKPTATTTADFTAAKFFKAM
jgi:hypothetical protein